MRALRALWLVATFVLGGFGAAMAQSSPQDGGINEWLLRMHEASRHRTYTGTFVVSAGSQMASAKIWHICDGSQQMERVESLSGPQRSTFRRDGQVVTFYPDSKIVVSESRDSLGLFPNLLKSPGTQIADFYQMKSLGKERMVGVDCDVVQLIPKDTLRYGYRVWSEKRTGLVVQLQTLDTDGRVIEQSAFSELQLDAPVSMAKLSQMMANTSGYKIVRPDMQKTTAEAQGWALRKPVAGFKPAGCFTRPVAALAGATNNSANTMQWMFSDGLATVSLFVEAFDAQRHLHEGAADFGGATRAFTRRIDDWWVTSVGEIPAATLSLFAQSLDRKR